MSSRQQLQKVVLAEVEKIPGLSGLRVLDLSCGDAELLSRLAECGCACVGTRYKEGDYILRGKAIAEAVEIVDGVDLSKRLPFEDASFDVVMLQEVIEHLPNHSSIIYEIGRVLRPGGYLILSTPNIHRLHSRLHFFLTGAHKLKCRRIGWELGRDDLYARHFNPVDFPILHTLLYLAGIRIQRIPSTIVKGKYLPLLLLYPIILLCARFEFGEGGMRAAANREGEGDLRRWMCSKAVLVSEQLLLIGRKKS